ncbi:MAG: LCP family protein [Patescibacteria group bacterium]|nr:LCP family protein [Patescibacteria group bacterium]
MERKIDDVSKIDLLTDFSRRQVNPQESGWLKAKKTILKLALIFLFIAILFFTNILFAGNGLLGSSNQSLPKTGFISFINQIKEIFIPSDNDLSGEDQDRINILLLGMGGVQHDGPYLTDTIILVSIKPSTNQVALISIPRDLYAPIPSYGWRKINNANSFGEVDGTGGGELAAQTVSQILDLPVHYYVRIDFDGFTQLIDDLGGITLEVDNSFIDKEYPAPNYDYQTISFEVGKQKMDGETALIYARSRHGNNGEGSDFARGKRQQKVILAVKDKVFSLNTLIQPQKIWKIYDNINQHVKTNLTVNQINSLLTLAKNFNKDNLINVVLDDGINGYLKSNITPDGAYVLIPVTGNFRQIADMTNNIFQNNSTIEKDKVDSVNDQLETKSTLSTPEPEIEKINAKIIILNGSGQTGLASQVANQLSPLGYQIVKIGNADRWDYEKSVIYNLNSENKPENLKLLKQELEANISDTTPTYLQDLVALKPDFIIVLGLNHIQP